MKYRIKTITYPNGSKVFKPYVRILGIWFGISYYGKIDLFHSADCAIREYAIKRCKEHRDKKWKRKVKTENFNIDE